MTKCCTDVEKYINLKLPIRRTDKCKTKHNSTMSKIIYIAGVVLAVLAVLDILKKPISTFGKVISIILVLVTSWIGIIVYYLYAKDHLTEWFK